MSHQITVQPAGRQYSVEADAERKWEVCRGIGRSFVDAALNRDYSVMMGVTILVGALTILFNLVVDILYAWIDPKIRY